LRRLPRGLVSACPIGFGLGFGETPLTNSYRRNAVAEWLRKIDLKPVWHKAKAGEVSTQVVAAEIARQLQAMQELGDDYIDMKRADLADEFDGFAEDGEASVQEFDRLMDELYDWGDMRVGEQGWPYRKVCWIATNF
jgi:hypothetical protein